MAKELSEDTAVQISLKTLAGIAVGLGTIISMWFVLQADIAEAKLLPAAPDPGITRMEFDMKDQLFSVFSNKKSTIHITGAQYSGPIVLNRPSHGLSNKVTENMLCIKPHQSLVTLFLF